MVLFDNIEIGNFDPTNNKSATTKTYVDNLLTSSKIYVTPNKIGILNMNPTEELDVTGTIQSNSIKTNLLTVWNPLNTSNQDAILNLNVAGTSAGNPFVSFNVQNESNSSWSLGLDNTDNNFKIKNTADFSTTGNFVLNQNGFLGLNVGNPTAEIHLPSINANKRILLFDIQNNQHQFTGLGTQNNGSLRYQVSGEDSDHIFFSGNIIGSTISSKELIRIKGNGRIKIGNNEPIQSKMSLAVNSDEPNTIYGLQILSNNNNSKGAGVLLTNNGVGGGNYGIVSEAGKLNFVDQISTPTNILSIDRNAGLELKNSSRTHLLVDGTLGNIGIGTTGPQSQLHIFNTGNSSFTLESSSNSARVNFITGPTGGQEMSLSFNKTGDFSIDQIKINNQLLSDASQNKLSINRNGNVEITQNLNVMGKIQENGSDLLPTGTILPFAGENVPTGFLLCDGKSYSSTDISYNRLFGVILRKYGGNADPNNPTFKVPDLRCRFPLGAGTTNGTGLFLNDGTIESLSTKSLASMGGTETHQLTENEIAKHSHTGSTNLAGEHFHSLQHWNDDYNNIGGDNKKIGFIANDNKGDAKLKETNKSGSHNHTLTINTTGKNFAHENMPPYLVINYIIKL
jgi:microcystin-dependent protein